MDQSCAVAKAGENIAARVLILFVRPNYTSTRFLFLQFGGSRKQTRGVYRSQHEARGSDESILVPSLSVIKTTCCFEHGQ